jgi:hypothetical protein
MRALFPVLRGVAHDKAMFDASGLSDWLPNKGEQGRDLQKEIMADLGYLEINRTYPTAVLPHKLP